MSYMVVNAPIQKSRESLLGDSSSDLVLQVRGGEHDGRVVRLHSPKCTIGSGPNCTLRLRSAGVLRLHCLILRGQYGTVIRRWSPCTRLNGGMFVDAPLRTGDRITVGHVELEVLELETAPSDGSAGPRASDPIVDSTPPVAEDHVARLEGRIAELEAELAAFSEEGSSRTITFDELKTSNDSESIEQAVADARQEVERELAKRQEDFDRLRTTWHQDRDRLEAELSATRDQIAGMKHDLAAAEQQLAATTESEEASSVTRSDLQRRYESVIADCERLQAELAESQQHAEQLEREHRQAMENAASASARCEEIEGSAAALERKLEEARSERDRHVEELNEARQRVGTLESELAAAAAEAEGELAAARSEFEQRHESVVADCQQLRAELVEMRRHAEQLRLERHGATEDAVRASARCEEIEHAAAALEREIAETRTERDRQLEELSAAREKIGALEAELSAATEEAAMAAQLRGQLDEERFEFESQRQAWEVRRLELEAEQSCAQEQVEALQRQCAQWETQQESYDQQEDVRKTQIRELHDELENVRRSSNAAAELKSKLHTADNEASKWRDQADWWRRRAEQLEIGAQQRQRSEAEFSESLTLEQAEFDKERAAWKQEQDRLEAEIASSREELARLREQVEQQGGEVRQQLDRQLAAEHNELDQREQRFIVECEEWRQQRETDEADLAQRRAEFERQQAEFAVQRDEFERLNESNEQNQAAEQSAQARLDELEESLRIGQAEWEQQRSWLEAELAAKSSEVDQLRQHQAELEHAQTELEQRQTETDEASRRELDAERAAFENERRCWQQECERLEAELESKTLLVAERQAGVQQQRSELEIERQAFQEERETFERERESHRTDADALSAHQEPPTCEQTPPASEQEQPSDEVRTSPPQMTMLLSDLTLDLDAQNPPDEPPHAAGDPSIDARAEGQPDAASPESSFRPETFEIENAPGAESPFGMSTDEGGEADEIEYRPPSSGTPVSALEVLSRLGHGDMLEDQKASDDSPAPEPSNEAPPAMQAAETPDFTSTAPNSGGSIDGDSTADEEESIEQYMSRLLKRVRGDDKPASDAGQKPEPVSSPPPRATSPDVPPATPDELKQISINVVDPGQNQDFLPRSHAPELSSKLMAMRELANESARTAIDRSVRKRGGAQAAGRFLVAAVAGIVGVVLLVLSDSGGAHMFNAGTAVLVVGILFAVRGVLDARKSIAKTRKRSNRATRDVGPQESTVDEQVEAEQEEAEQEEAEQENAE